MNLFYAYNLLNVSPFSPKKEIREKYLKMVNIFHPDKLKHSKEHKAADLDITIEDINEAYNLIISSIDNKKLFSGFTNVNVKIKKASSSLDHQNLISKFNQEIFEESENTSNAKTYDLVLISEETKTGVSKIITINNKTSNYLEKILVKIPPGVINGQTILFKDKNNNDFFVTINIQ